MTSLMLSAKLRRKSLLILRVYVIEETDHISFDVPSNMASRLLLL